jgi:hypothetical protein
MISSPDIAFLQTKKSPHRAGFVVFGAVALLMVDHSSRGLPATGKGLLIQAGMIEEQFGHLVLRVRVTNECTDYRYVTRSAGLRMHEVVDKLVPPSGICVVWFGVPSFVCACAMVVTLG